MDDEQLNNIKSIKVLRLFKQTHVYRELHTKTINIDNTNKSTVSELIYELSNDEEVIAFKLIKNDNSEEKIKTYYMLSGEW